MQVVSPWTRCPCAVHSLYSCAQQPCKIYWRERGSWVVQGLENGDGGAIFLCWEGTREGEGEEKGAARPVVPGTSIRVRFWSSLDRPVEDAVSPGTSYRLLLFLFQVTGELVVGRSYRTPEGCFDPTLTPDHHSSSCIPTQPELLSWEGQKEPLLFLVVSLSLPLPVWMEEGKDISSCPGALPMSWGS